MKNNNNYQCQYEKNYWYYNMSHPVVILYNITMQCNTSLLDI